MQQLPTMLGTTVYCGKDTTRKTLETTCNARAWPQQFWMSCANGSNIVALRVGDHRTKEMLGVVGSKVWPVQTLCSNSQQHATTCNRVCKRTQHVTSNKVGRCWPTMLRPFALYIRTSSSLVITRDMCFPGGDRALNALSLVSQGIWVLGFQIVRSGFQQISIYFRCLGLVYMEKTCPGSSRVDGSTSQPSQL